MQENSGVQTWQWVLTVLVIVGVLALAGFLIFRGDNDGMTDEEHANQINNNIVEVNRISLVNQFPGNIVHVAVIQLAKGGFVVIRKDNNGVAGDIIGTQYFDAGTRPGSVKLTENTVDGKTYYAYLYSDNGNKIFNPGVDAPILNASNNPIFQMFKATTNLTEDKG